MGFESRPNIIKEAIASDNKELLSKAGLKGAKVSNEKQERERQRKEISQLHTELEVELRKIEDLEMRESANEHIISPDGEDQDFAE